MGWWYTRFNGIKETHRDILEELGDRVVAHKSTAFGRRLWVVYKNAVIGDKNVMLLYLCNTYKEDGVQWGGYKPIDEDMGILESDCPLSLLDMLDEPRHDWSREWREKVRKYHAERAKKVEVSKGDEFDLYGRVYTCVGKKGRSLLADMNGTTYRVGPKHFPYMKKLEA